MNNWYLSQRSYYGTRVYELVDDGVEVIETAFLSSKRYRVPFEHILDETYEVTVRSKPMFWATVILGGIALIDVVDTVLTGGSTLEVASYCSFFALICGIQLWRSRETYIIHAGGEPALAFYKDNPSADELKAFVEVVQTKKQEYLRKKYMPTIGHSGSTADELQKLAWLKEHGVLKEDEFEKLKQDLVNEQRGFIGLN